MLDGKLIGGKWNFDVENCKKLLKDLRMFLCRLVWLDLIVRDVVLMVEEEFVDYFGIIQGFDYVVMWMDVE